MKKPQSWGVGIFLLIVFLLFWGYFALFEAFGNGRTLGKRVAKIRVIHQSGRGINFVEALARNLVRFIDYLPGFYGVGVVAMFMSRRSQRLGDMVAGTLVVREREVEAPMWGESTSRTLTAAALAPQSPIPPPASACSAARAGSGQALPLWTSKCSKAFSAPARHGSRDARRTGRAHCLGPVREVRTRHPSGNQRGNLP